MIHQLKADGLNHSQIARRLNLDRKTVLRYLSVELDGTVTVFTGYGRFHAVIKHLPGRTGKGLEAGHVHGQQRGQFLVLAKASPQVARMTQHHGEQIQPPPNAGIGQKLPLEIGKVHLHLPPGRGLEANLIVDRFSGRLLRQCNGGVVFRHTKA